MRGALHFLHSVLCLPCSCQRVPPRGSSRRSWAPPGRGRRALGRRGGWPKAFWRSVRAEDPGKGSSPQPPYLGYSNNCNQTNSITRFFDQLCEINSTFFFSQWHGFWKFAKNSRFARKNVKTREKSAFRAKKPRKNHVFSIILFFQLYEFWKNEKK